MNTSGNARSWTYTVSGSGSVPDSGAVAVVAGDWLSGISDAAGNAATNPASGVPVVSGAFTVNSAVPAPPTLTLGEGLPNGASASEALATRGVLTLQAEAQSTVLLTFSDSQNNSRSKTLLANGSNQAVLLEASDIGSAAGQLHDGSISVVAIASNTAGLASAPAVTSFTLDTLAPLVQSFLLDASKTDGTPLSSGDVLFFSIHFDDSVVGTPIAPTLSIGLETGIALTPQVTSGPSRSWIYTISKGGTQPDNGAVSVLLDSSASGLSDAAGNAVDAAAGTVLLPSAFSVDTSSPAAPLLNLGTGVANGATAAEATQSSGLFSFTADAGSTVTLQLEDGSGHRLHKTLSATGSAQAVLLDASEIGTEASQLHDGPIAVFAIASHAAASSSASLLSLHLDSLAPQLQSAVLSRSRSDGSAAAIGDELTYTLSYDSVVFGTPTAPTLRIGSETGIAMTPVVTSGASRSWRYVLGSGNTPASGAIGVVDGNYIDGITDAAGNPAVDATGGNGSHGGGGAAGGSSGETTPPPAPILALGEGVADGASALEAVQASGVLLLTAEAGSTVRVLFSDGQHTVAQTVVATGSTQPLVLGAADVGLSLTALRDGPIAVWAVASNTAGLSSPASLTSFTLDTTGPQLLGVAISAGKSESTALSTGDVLTITASYDEAVFGTPTAPTLAIGTETGIALTPVNTSGNARSWTYTVSGSGSVPDSGAVAVVAGDWLSGISDAAGNAATNPASGVPVVSGAFTVNSAVPAPPTLTLGEGLPNGASASEALATRGVLTLQAEAQSTVLLTFSDSQNNSRSKTLLANGSNQAVLLEASDIGSAAGQLHDGSISVVAIASNTAGLASAPAVTSFTLDTLAPLVQSFLLDASKTDGTPLSSGDVLFFSIHFDDSVVGTPIAPTLSIGLETGIALTPQVTSGPSRSWIYTISKGGTQPDNGAVSVLLDSSASGLSDAAGNAVDAAAGTVLLPSAFSVDTSSPAAPLLNLGTGVANGATAAEATQSSGLFSFTADAGSTVTLQLEDGSGHRLHKTLSATGSAQAVLLDASEIGTEASQLHDGPIAVFAIASHAAASSSASLLSLHLDSLAPQLQSAVLSRSRSDGSAAAIGDELTYTLSYDSVVFGTPTAPTLRIGSETGIAMTPVVTSGASRSWRYVLGSGNTPASGAIGVVDGNYIDGITDAAGNPAVDATGGNGSHGGGGAAGGSSGETTPPPAPILALGEGVADGASALEAVQASGVLLLTAEAGSTVRVLFSDGQHTVAQTVVATGSTQPLVLGAADVGLSLTALRDGPIAVWAVASNTAGLSSPASLTSFTLDTTGPQLLGVAISAGKSESTALSTGDVLTITASYDEAVFGTPTAPTLAIGTETGIGLTPVITSGATRSWRYTISSSDTADLGAIALEGGNFTSALHDAAGNPAFYPASDTPAYTGFYRANSNSSSNRPAAPLLQLAGAVAQGASADQATAASGVLTLQAESGSSVVIRFTDSQANSIAKTLLATGSEQAVLGCQRPWRRPGAIARRQHPRQRQRAEQRWHIGQQQRAGVFARQHAACRAGAGSDRRCRGRGFRCGA